MTSGKVTGRSAVRGSVVTSLWTLFSRVLGFARDALMATTLGMTPVYGAFSVAWIVPNLFRRLFGEGSVSAAVQPALAREREERGEDAARQLFGRFHGFTFLVLVTLLALGEAGVLIWRALVPVEGTDRDQAARDAFTYASLLIPYALPICLTAIATAPQHMAGKFVLPAAAPVLLNVIWIVAVIVLGDSLTGDAPGAPTLCLVLLGAGCLQWALQAPGLRRLRYPILPRFAPGDGRVRQTIRSFAPALVGLAAIQINLAVDQALIWKLVSPEANAYAYLANRLLQLPLALIGIAAATGALPLFARLAAERRFGELSAALRNATESTLLLIVAAAAGLYVVAGPVVLVLFEHGKFDADDAYLLRDTLQAYLWCLPGAALSGLFTRARQSRGDFRGPALIGLGCVPVNLALDVLLLPQLGVPGAGYATAVALTLQSLLLYRGLRRWEIDPPLLLRRMPLLLLPGVGATLAAWGTVAALGDSAATLYGLAFAIGAGVLAAVVSTAALLPREFAALLATLRRRRPRA